MTITAVQSGINLAAEEIGKLADRNVETVPQWLAYLAEAIESEVGEGWLYDLERIIRERREGGGW